MLDAELLRRNFSAVAENLGRRGLRLDPAEFEALEARRKSAQQTAETLRAQRNRQAREFRDGEDLSAAKTAKTGLQEAEQDMHEARAAVENYCMRLPNTLHESVPDGGGETENVEVRRWGTPREFSFPPLDHAALGDALGMMDFAAGADLAGSRFVVLSAQLARLHRALAQFMLDVHVREHGYTEYYVPQLANSETMRGAGQLPKFAAEVYAAERDDLYLIPTAEVALVNLARGKIFDAAALPLRFTAHTACFRREAGAHGKDTRGMLRQHQFDKVELVRIDTPENSYAGLEEMTAHAEKILQLLEIPYRAVALCGGDIGFAAAKTYDLEVWLPGQNRYREISSCSNCEGFQARRIKARYRGANGRPAPVHTLNGSGVAVGRALIALLENHQQSGGAVRIPPPLAPYMGGLEVIGAEDGKC
ncbi:MAG: serine--tRNA ligase [Gammaproteobacteria bacterium]